LYPDHSQSKLLRMLNYLSFAFSSMLLGFWLISPPNVMFVYHPPLTVGLPAIFLSRLWRIPFVYQIQDMWPETLEATGMLNNKTILKWIAQFSQWVYAYAASICIISPGFRTNLLTKGVTAEKLHVISNWVDTAVYYPVPPDPTKAQSLAMANRFNIMFAGNIGKAQGLQTVVEAAVMLGDLPRVQFVIVGDGIALSSLQALAKKHNLQNIKFIGRYPVSEMPLLYALADVLLVHLRDEPLFRITIPHKIFAYMASGKPILAAVEGDVSDLILRAGAGLACPPEDAKILAETIRLLYSMPEEDRQKMGRNGLHLISTTYHRDNLIAQIEAILQNVTQGDNYFTAA
ncbi:MAG: glycosyltransferase family 4 protein, partial [Caldilineaceae bacterium]|nr:glycosyltransferase family 4 protein [Caldilineaceae bacterium]